MEDLLITDEQLIKMAQEGSETAEEILIEKYKGLVIAVAKAKNYLHMMEEDGNHAIDNDDVIQEGMIGLFKAIRSFDNTKDAKFKTYADTCINNQILNAIKSANRKKNQILTKSVSLSQSVGDEDALTLGDTLTASINDEPEHSVIWGEIVKCLKRDDEGIFSPLEKEVLIAKLNGLSYQEIAKSLNKTPKSIDNTLQRIKEKVVKYLER